MKRIVASVAIILGALSVVSAQDSRHQQARQDVIGVVGSTIGAFVGSTIGNGHGRPLAIGAGALLGGLIGESLSQRCPAANSSNSMVQRLGEQRNRVVDAAVTWTIPMPRKATPVRRRQGLALCQELEPGTFACQDAAGIWRIVR